MDTRHRLVIANPDDIELVDIVRQGILENDCYRLASDIIITSEQKGISLNQIEGSKEKLNRLMVFLDRDSHSMILK